MITCHTHMLPYKLCKNNHLAWKANTIESHMTPTLLLPFTHMSAVVLIEICGCVFVVNIRQNMCPSGKKFNYGKYFYHMHPLQSSNSKKRKQK